MNSLSKFFTEKFLLYYLHSLDFKKTVASRTCVAKLLHPASPLLRRFSRAETVCNACWSVIFVVASFRTFMATITYSPGLENEPDSEGSSQQLLRSKWRSGLAIHLLRSDHWNKGSYLHAGSRVRNQTLYKYMIAITLDCPPPYQYYV